MQREGRYPMRSMVGRCELYIAFRPGLRPGGGLVGARGRNSHRANNAQPPLTWEVDNTLQPRAEAREKAETGSPQRGDDGRCGELGFRLLRPPQPEP